MSRLPLNFHQTFIPERRYISILLEKIKDSINLNDQELSALTSIPMGSSSGKLPAMLAYAKGMGLLKIESGSERTISLTPLGKLIKEEDLFLQEGLTQWILHLELCKKTTGAELWYQVFTSCFQSITGSFTTNKLELLLEKKVSKKSRNMASPVLRTYNDDAALALVDIIKLEKNSSDTYIISNPPLFNSYSYYYGYLLFSLLEESSLKNDIQITTDALNIETEYIHNLCLTKNQFEKLLLNLESLDIINIDKQMSPWILHKKTSKEDLLKKIYDLL